MCVQSALDLILIFDYFLQATLEATSHVSDLDFNFTLILTSILTLILTLILT
jgi:hypothetical protein